MKDKLINALIRAGRTFAQAALGTYVAGLSGVVPVLGDLASVDLVKAAIASGLVALVWNLYEQLGGPSPIPRG